MQYSGLHDIHILQVRGTLQVGESTDKFNLAKSIFVREIWNGTYLSGDFARETSIFVNI